VIFLKFSANFLTKNKKINFWDGKTDGLNWLKKTMATFVKEFEKAQIKQNGIFH